MRWGLVFPSLIPFSNLPPMGSNASDLGSRSSRSAPTTYCGLIIIVMQPRCTKQRDMATAIKRERSTSWLCCAASFYKDLHLREIVKADSPIYHKRDR